MNYAEIAGIALKSIAHPNTDPFRHLTPRKRKKRWNLVMKQATRRMNKDIEAYVERSATRTILWGNVMDPTSWSSPYQVVAPFPLLTDGPVT